MAVAGCGGNDERPAPAPAPEAPRAGTGATSTPRPEALQRARGRPRVETVASGLEIPWDLAFLPDGGALVTERPGRVRLLGADGRLRARVLATVEVDDAGEGGLLGVVVDPRFERNRFVYLYRTTSSGNEVVRYRMIRERLEEQAVVVRGIRSGVIHDGGRMRFGPGGELYLTSGEAGQEDLAQEPSSLNGKILRMSPEQYRGRGGRPEVFSTGHRNPQGLDWQPGTGRLVSDEHGPDGDDEINFLRRGANYGWPRIRGEEAGGGLVKPVVVYPESIAPSGATFVRRPGSAWTGDYLIGALVGEQVRRVTIDRSGRVTRNEALFERQFGRIRTVVEGPDGTLYLLTNNRDGRGSSNTGDDRILRVVPPAG
ncbi:MAG: PQQ-dependent sugar dehydrogenase [Actinomycetota bacterium]|nr:PQQ-dependent sugar dehydrogenase [Actinomycetota bacterium]